MQSLLDLLRGRPQNSLFAEPEFAEVIHAAEEESVQPWVAQRLRVIDGETTPNQRKRLDEIRRHGQLSAFFWTETLKSTLGAFHRAQLSAIALKGPCLAERLYGDASLRPCYDLDLLVRFTDWTRAVQLLTELGFSPNSHADDYHQAWGRKGINLELHHNVENPFAFEFDVEAAWTRAQLARFHDVPVWLLAPADELEYLCLHAVRHRFERLSLMLDLALAFRRLPFRTAGEPNWGSPVFGNILALGAMMAARLNPEVDPKVPPGIGSEIGLEIPGRQSTRIPARDRNRLETLADRLWDELMLAPPPALDWAAQHRFYLELETPGWSRFRRRWRHGRILLTRLIDDDFVFAGRFHLHRNWQVRLLRPIRLLMKALRLSPKTQ